MSETAKYLMIVSMDVDPEHNACFPAILGRTEARPDRSSFDNVNTCLLKPGTSASFLSSTR